MPFEFSQVFQMGHAMMWLKKLELFTGGEVVALPAAFEFLFSGTFSYLAVRWPTIASAGLLAAHLHHCP